MQVKHLAEKELHRLSRGKTLVIGREAYERLREPFQAERVYVVDRQLPPTVCRRLSSVEVLAGGVQFAVELAGPGAVLYAIDQ